MTKSDSNIRHIPRLYMVNCKINGKFSGKEEVQNLFGDHDAQGEGDRHGKKTHGFPSGPANRVSSVWKYHFGTSK